MSRPRNPWRGCAHWRLACRWHPWQAMTWPNAWACGTTRRWAPPPPASNEAKSAKKTAEVRLRPAVELYAVAACAGAAFLSLVAPWSLALSPAMGVGSAMAFGAYGAIRYRDARVILRYRRNIRRLPRYVMTSRDVPVSQQRLFIGRGFLWEQKHTHRLVQTYRPEF